MSCVKRSKQQTPPFPQSDRGRICAAGAPRLSSAAWQWGGPGKTGPADRQQPQQRVLPPTGRDSNPVYAEVFRAGSALSKMEHRIRKSSLLDLFGLFLNSTKGTGILTERFPSFRCPKQGAKSPPSHRGDSKISCNELRGGSRAPSWQQPLIHHLCPEKSQSTRRNRS